MLANGFVSKFQLANDAFEFGDDVIVEQSRQMLGLILRARANDLESANELFQLMQVIFCNKLSGRQILGQPERIVPRVLLANPLLRNSAQLVHRSKYRWHVNADATNPLIKDIRVLAVAIDLRERSVHGKSKISIIAADDKSIRFVRIYFADN